MLKKVLLLLLRGLIPLLITALFMKFISLNISYAVIVGVISLFSISYFLKENGIPLFWRVLLLSGPIILGFYALIINELPSVWIALPLFILATFLGVLDVTHYRKNLLGLGLLIVTGLVSFMILPNMITDDLIKDVSKPSPEYQLLNLDEKSSINKEALKGKIVVIDFFGTWCRPCISEMEELEKVKEYFKDNSNILFAIACTDVGGDTPKKAVKFKNDRNLPFMLLYDEKSSVHKSFGFTGVPALTLIDKKGNIRLTHQGYNEAEMLSERLISIIDKIANEGVQIEN